MAKISLTVFCTKNLSLVQSRPILCLKFNDNFSRNNEQLLETQFNTRRVKLASKSAFH